MGQSFLFFPAFTHFPRLIPTLSITAGSILGLLLVLQSSSVFRPSSSPITGSPNSPDCDSQKPSHVYALNPKPGTDYEGIGHGILNVSGDPSCDLGRRRLLNRDEIRLRSTVREFHPDETAGSNVIPVFGRVFPDGLYYIAVAVGDPPRTYYLDIDTGSDLTWINCDAPCVSCAKGPHPYYDPSRASLVDCRDSLCSKVQTGEIHGCSKESTDRQCDYDVHYGDGSSSQGVLVRDQFAILKTDGKLQPAQVAFGCAYDQEGALLHSFKTDGILGLGSSPVSLPSQLAAQGVTQNVVGHCLKREAEGGYFFLGSDLVPAGMTWTNMLGKPEADYYSVDLQKVEYGSSDLGLNPDQFSLSNGGTIFDSGSSFSYFAPDSFRGLLQAVVSRLSQVQLTHDSSDHKFPNCWRGSSWIKHVSEVVNFFDPIRLHMGKAGWFWSSQVLTLYPDNYLFVDGKGGVCLGIFDSSLISPGGATTIIGDNALRGYLVVYDNVLHKIGWMEKDCSVRL